MLVSARMPKGILFLEKELGICQPIICYSGALILDKNLNTLLNNYIEISYIKEIYSKIKNYNIHMSLYKDNEWYIEKMDKWAVQEKEITNIVPAIKCYQELFISWERKNEGCNKILCMGKQQEIESLKIKLRKIFKDNLNIYPSKSTYLELMPKNSSKTSAIEFLLQKYNICRDDLMAIGDNYNDIDMIKYAGLGIAMGNAPDEVKKQANTITLSNDDEGVSYAINNYVLV